MSGKRTIRIGFLGFGTVGQGVWKHLENNCEALELRLGAKLELVRACVRDVKKKRPVSIPEEKLTSDPNAVIGDPELDIICELAGGVGDARAFTLRALEAGKVVVTANKALICEHGAALFEAARRGGGHYFFEASVAGGIPIIKTLREGLVANRFSDIHGIINGTANYILTRMEREGRTFGEIVEDARRLGYVEADETLDLDGWDAAHKAVILAYLAHGKWIGLDEMLVEGIRKVTLSDVRAARQLGFKVKLLAIISRDFAANTVFARVHPALVPLDNLLASVDEVYNGISLTGDVVGTTVLVGRGAGQDATASAVISDIADAVVALLGAPPPVISEEDAELYRQLGEGLGIARLEQVKGRYYLRLKVKDEPGVLAKVAEVLARDEISIATLLQEQDREETTANLLLTTHETNEQAVGAACGHLAELASVMEEPFVLRIFEPVH